MSNSDNPGDGRQPPHLAWASGSSTSEKAGRKNRAGHDTQSYHCFMMIAACARGHLPHESGATTHECFTYLHKGGFIGPRVREGTIAARLSELRNANCIQPVILPDGSVLERPTSDDPDADKGTVFCPVPGATYEGTFGAWKKAGARIREGLRTYNHLGQMYANACHEGRPAEEREALLQEIGEAAKVAWPAGSDDPDDDDDGSTGNPDLDLALSFF